MLEPLGISRETAHFQQRNGEQNPTPTKRRFVVDFLQRRDVFAWFHFVDCFHG